MIDTATLEDRRIYRLKCRNLRLGVWSAETEGFIGIRTKFGEQYLDVEYPQTREGEGGRGKWGTVDQAIPTEDKLDPNTANRIIIGHVDSLTGRSLTFSKPRAAWCHEDGTTKPNKGLAYPVTNQLLFRALSDLEEELSEAQEREREQAKEATTPPTQIN